MISGQWLSNLTSLPCFHSFFQLHHDQSSSLHHISLFSKMFLFLFVIYCRKSFNFVVKCNEMFSCSSSPSFTIVLLFLLLLLLLLFLSLLFFLLIFLLLLLFLTLLLLLLLSYFSFQNNPRIEAPPSPPPSLLTPYPLLISHIQRYI